MMKSSSSNGNINTNVAVHHWIHQPQKGKEVPELGLHVALPMNYIKIIVLEHFDIHMDDLALSAALLPLE